MSQITLYLSDTASIQI